MPITIQNYNQAGYLSSNAVRFVREDDTAVQRKDLTITRKPSAYNAAQKEFSIPEYRIVVRRDTVDETGKRPTGQRLSVDLTIRDPLYAENEDFDQAIEDLLAFVNDPGFKDTIKRQLFPVECKPCTEP